LPLVFAIQDFHQPRSMTWSGYALVEYLYGIRQMASLSRDGAVEKVTTKVESYKWKDKEIPAGFFLQPDTEHISAVIANPSGTLAKFDRMGLLGGFGDPRVYMVREGMCFVESSDVPEEFRVEVNSHKYSETWVEGLYVYHNPRATHPLPEYYIPGAAHYTSKDGSVSSVMPPFQPIGSITLILETV